MSFVTGTTTELIYASANAANAQASFQSETLINNSGMGVQAHLPPDFWLPSPNQVGRGIKIVARGILSVTAATNPGYSWRIRAGVAGLGTTVVLLGTAPAQATGLPTTGSPTSSLWELEGEIFVTTMGVAGATATTVIRGIGMLKCPGLATPFAPLWAADGGATAAATVTASPGATTGSASSGFSLDTATTNYINFNMCCSAAAAAGNTVTLQQLLVYGLN
jgi:hypothetical protein